MSRRTPSTRNTIGVEVTLGPGGRPESVTTIGKAVAEMTYPGETRMLNELVALLMVTGQRTANPQVFPVQYARSGLRPSRTRTCGLLPRSKAVVPQAA